MVNNDIYRQLDSDEYGNQATISTYSSTSFNYNDNNQYSSISTNINEIDELKQEIKNLKTYIEYLIQNMFDLTDNESKQVINEMEKISEDGITWTNKEVEEKEEHIDPSLFKI